MKIARALPLMSVFVLLAAGCRESHNTITGLVLKEPFGRSASSASPESGHEIEV